MKIRNNIGESGKSIMEYVPENDDDRATIAAMMMRGEIPDAPSQSHPENNLPEEE